MDTNTGGSTEEIHISCLGIHHFPCMQRVMDEPSLSPEIQIIYSTYTSTAFYFIVRSIRTHSFSRLLRTCISGTINDRSRGGGG